MQAPHAVEVPPPDDEELSEGDPPVLAGGDHADWPHVGAPVVDEAARGDQLGDRVAQVHGKGHCDSQLA